MSCDASTVKLISRAMFSEMAIKWLSNDYQIGLLRGSLMYTLYDEYLNCICFAFVSSIVDKLFVFLRLG